MNIHTRLRALATDLNADTITLGVPLFIKLLEWAREEAKEDEPLHVVAEHLVAVCAGGNAATMADYDGLINFGQKTP